MPPEALIVVDGADTGAGDRATRRFRRRPADPDRPADIFLKRVRFDAVAGRALLRRTIDGA
jgi:hypothetical protein